MVQAHPWLHSSLPSTGWRSDPSHSINAEAFIEITGQELQSSPKRVAKL